MPGKSSTETATHEVDPDLERAATLIALHNAVKLRYQETGLDEELGQARGEVQKVLGSLSLSA